MIDLKNRRLGRLKVEYIEDGDEDDEFMSQFDQGKRETDRQTGRQADRTTNRQTDK